MADTGDQRRLYVGNLPFSFSNAALRDVFSAYGATECRIGRTASGSRGFGFVGFETQVSAGATGHQHQGTLLIKGWLLGWIGLGALWQGTVVIAENRDLASLAAWEDLLEKSLKNISATADAPFRPERINFVEQIDRQLQAEAATSGIRRLGHALTAH